MLRIVKVSGGQWGPFETGFNSASWVQIPAKKRLFFCPSKNIEPQSQDKEIIEHKGNVPSKDLGN